MISLATLATIIVLQGKPAVRRFPVGYLDFHGFVPVEQATMDARTKTGMDQLKRGESRTAYRTLTQAWGADRGNYVALHGLTLAAGAQGTLDKLIERFDRLWRGGRKPYIEPQAAFALFYATTVAEELRREGDKSIRIPGMAGRPNAYSSDQTAMPLPQKVGNRAYTLMMASARFADSDYVPARRALIDWLAAHPKDALVHVMLGRMYQSGIFSHQSGGGPRRIAPPEEQMDMNKAYAQYRKALAVDPRCAEAWYDLGFSLPSGDPQKIISLRNAVRIGLHDPERQDLAKKKLQELTTKG